jgi:hypothetical protein
MKAYNIPSCIEQLKVTLVQAPADITGNRAICSVSVVLANGKQFTELGDAIETNTTTSNEESSIDIASAKALDRVLTRIATNEDSSPSNPWDNDRGEDMFDLKHSKSARSKVSGGGGDKPISEKQIKYIDSLCNKCGKDSENMANEMFGKALANLQGADANMLIKKLTGK